jgi:hypothetical protein
LESKRKKEKVSELRSPQPPSFYRVFLTWYVAEGGAGENGGLYCGKLDERAWNHTLAKCPPKCPQMPKKPKCPQGVGIWNLLCALELVSKCPLSHSLRARARVSGALRLFFMGGHLDGMRSGAPDVAALRAGIASEGFDHSYRTGPLMTIGSTAFQEPNRLCDQVPTLRVSRVLDLIVQIAKSIKHST